MITILLYATMTLAMVQTEPEQAVARGQESLDRSWGEYPWYDAQNDGVKPIDIPKPAASRRSASHSPSASWLTPLLNWLLWSLLIVVVAALIFLLVRTYLRDGNLDWTSHTPENQEEKDQKRRIEALPFPIKASKLDFLAEARRYYEQGQYGEAIKYLFSYELVQLDRHRVVRLTRGKTNRQYLREVSRSRLAVLVRPLEQTMLVFEDFFFGDHPVDRLRFEACWAQLAQFEAQCKGENQ